MGVSEKIAGTSPKEVAPTYEKDRDQEDDDGAGVEERPCDVLGRDGGDSVAADWQGQRVPRRQTRAHSLMM